MLLHTVYSTISLVVSLYSLYIKGIFVYVAVQISILFSIKLSENNTILLEELLELKPLWFVHRCSGSQKGRPHARCNQKSRQRWGLPSVPCLQRVLNPMYKGGQKWLYSCVYMRHRILMYLLIIVLFVIINLLLPNPVYTYQSMLSLYSVCAPTHASLLSREKFN